MEEEKKYYCPGGAWDCSYCDDIKGICKLENAINECELFFREEPEDFEVTE